MCKGPLQIYQIIIIIRRIRRRRGKEEVLYTNDNHNDINNNGTTNTYSNTGDYRWIQIQAKTQAKTGGLCRFQIWMFYYFLNSVLWHKERDTILTMLTIPNMPCILWCLRSLSVEIWKTQLHLSAQS